MTSPDPVLLGSYRGFEMTLSFDTFGKEYCATFLGALTHNVKLSADIYGNITRLDNVLEGFEAAMLRCESKLASTNEQVNAAKGEVDRPFLQEEEYKNKSARLKELNILLNMDEKDNHVFEAEPDEYDAEPASRVPGRER